MWAARPCAVLAAHENARGASGVFALRALPGGEIASAGRDGNVCLWDDRLPEPRPTLIVPNAHDVPAPGKRKRAGGPAPAVAQSVSCVCVVHDAAPKLARGHDLAACAGAERR